MSNLNSLKKQELINIILRKDEIEKNRSKEIKNMEKAYSKQITDMQLKAEEQEKLAESLKSELDNSVTAITFEQEKIKKLKICLLFVCLIEIMTLGLFIVIP